MSSEAAQKAFPDERPCICVVDDGMPMSVGERMDFRPHPPGMPYPCGAMSTRDELNADLQKVNDPARTADVLIAEGWRKKPDRHELWNVIDQYTVDGVTALNATDAILALMDRGQ